ncbi:MAG: alpha/beta fold hydrolase, partial [Burkholderiales bacterium]|nr:alpha/beta fold hydrolase [Burkholderiales bacterium]
MGGERSLIGLERFLRWRGYAVQTWGLGRNVGFHARHAKALAQKLRHLHHQSGRKVSLVGWSLGGLFALAAAQQAPECVRSVVTLGSPVSIDPMANASPLWIRALYRLVAHPLGPAAHAMQPSARRLRALEGLSAPLSCLYSISDGVVPPQEATVEGDPARRENIRVPGSHVGLGFNAAVLWIVAERLAQPQGQWRPFAPSGPLGAAYRALTHAALPV